MVQEHPGQILEAHFGRYRDFGLYTDSLAFYGARMFYYLWDVSPLTSERNLHDITHA